MTKAPELPPHCGSWVIVRKADGEAVLETYSRTVAEAVNREHYDVITVADWLGALNRTLSASNVVTKLANEIARRRE